MRKRVAFASAQQTRSASAWRGWGGVVALAAALACPLAQAQTRTLHAVGDREYPPITYLEDGQARGYDVDVLKALAQVLGWDLQVELLPWDLAQRRVLVGEADLLTGMSVTAERKESWDFARPTLVRTFSLFIATTDVGIRSIDDLRGKRIGVTAGGLPRTLIGRKPDVALVIVDDYEDGFRRLKARSIDALAADTWVAGYIIQQQRIGGVAVAGEPFAKLEAGIAVRKGNQALLREIDRGLDELREKGTIDEIRKRWEPKEVVFLLKEEVTSFVTYAAGVAIMLVLAGLLAWSITLRRENESRKKVETELRKFRTAVDASADFVALIDPHTLRYIDINDATCKALGYRREEMLAMSPTQAFSVEGEELQHGYRRVMEGDETAFRVEGRYRRRDGSSFPVESFRRAVPAAEGDVIVAIARDITARKLSEEKIKRLTRVHSVLSGINATIVRVTDRDELLAEACRVAVEAGGFRMAWLGLLDESGARVVPVAQAGDVRDYLERAPLAITEMKPGGRGLAGQAILEKKPVVSNDVRSDPRLMLARELGERGINSLAVLPLVVGDKAVGAISLYASDAGFFDDEEMRLLTELAGDISFALDHIAKEEKVRYLAYYDSITGIANRTLFLERLAQYVSTARNEGQQLALALFNIQRFKTINDAFGRQTGDALLKQVAGRLLEIARDPSRVARVGADHFAVVIPHVRSEESLIRGLEQGERRIDGDPYVVGDNELRLSTQAGVALFPTDAADAESLFRNAEAALRKVQSGERYVFYARHMTERIAEKVSLENQLRLALERDEFVLHYQPQVDTATGNVAGLEALIRWRSPELGLVPPMQFVPLLEETGLILPVGAWALKRASLDYHRLQSLDLAAPRIAVNVSPIQLRQRDFVGRVREAIANGQDATGIDLEITEHLVMEDIQASIEKLSAVRALGVNIAIDDFGTGYSSLYYLAKLPLQALKVDRSFIVSMLQNPDTLTVVSSVISLAHSLKLKVVAEGVDADDQALALRGLRCDQMQGFLFSEPLPFDALVALLKTGAGWAASFPAPASDRTRPQPRPERPIPP
jgi:diguanylate cyclase (GGDEF)-like protein/PAS domain S-box-containing protein